MKLWAVLAPTRSSLLVIFILYSAAFQPASMSSCLNVGTVIFGPMEALACCLDQEKYATLVFRKMLNNVISVPLQHAKDDSYICAFVTFVQISAKTAAGNSPPAIARPFVKALLDTSGGYIRSYLLPITLEGYYAGNVRFSEVKKLISLYNNIKDYLHTDGQGWTLPSGSYGVRHDVRCLEFSYEDHEEGYCENFLLNATSSCGDSAGPSAMPIPFLDDNKKPRSVALPLRYGSLHNIEAPDSAYILLGHYVKSVRCLREKGVSPSTFADYNKRFRAWIVKSVVPRLGDEKWYPAFGGILRVLKKTSDSLQEENIHGVDKIALKENARRRRQIFRRSKLINAALLANIDRYSLAEAISEDRIPINSAILQKLMQPTHEPLFDEIADDRDESNTKPAVEYGGNTNRKRVNSLNSAKYFKFTNGRFENTRRKETSTAKNSVNQENYRNGGKREPNGFSVKEEKDIKSGLYGYESAENEDSRSKRENQTVRHTGILLRKYSNTQESSTHRKLASKAFAANLRGNDESGNRDFDKQELKITGENLNNKRYLFKFQEENRALLSTQHEVGSGSSCVVKEKIPYLEEFPYSKRKEIKKYGQKFRNIILDTTKSTHITSEYSTERKITLIPSEYTSKRKGTPQKTKKIVTTENTSKQLAIDEGTFEGTSYDSYETASKETTLHISLADVPKVESDISIRDLGTIPYLPTSPTVNETALQINGSTAESEIAVTIETEMLRAASWLISVMYGLPKRTFRNITDSCVHRLWDGVHAPAPYVSRRRAALIASPVSNLDFVVCHIILSIFLWLILGCTSFGHRERETNFHREGSKERRSSRGGRGREYPKIEPLPATPVIVQQTYYSTDSTTRLLYSRCPDSPREPHTVGPAIASKDKMATREELAPLMEHTSGMSWSHTQRSARRLSTVSITNRTIEGRSDDDKGILSKAPLVLSSHESDRISEEDFIENSKIDDGGVS